MFIKSNQNITMEKQDNKCKKKPTKIEEMTKEQIRQAIIKKRECNAKAQNTVESLLEKCVTEEYFLGCLPNINQSHLEDIIEERAIIQLCGYPICSRALSVKDIPKQKYRISVKTNKVYDITARKSFCSNNCYKATMYVKNQMLTSPLWFREFEDVPQFHLMISDCLGSLGQEIDFGTVSKTTNAKPVKQLFTSINDFTQASLCDLNDDSSGTDKNLSVSAIEVNDSKVNALSQNNNVTNNKQDNHDESDKTNIIHEQKEMKDTSTNTFTTINPQKLVKEKPASANVELNKKTARNPLNIVGDIIEKAGKEIDPIILNAPLPKQKLIDKSKFKTRIGSKNEIPFIIIIKEVEKCLAEWFTLDTMLYLLGEDTVKEMVADKGECIKDYLNNYAKSVFYSSNTYDQYQDLCRKLNMLELGDRRYDAQTMQRETKPLPDYSVVQEESKKMQLKVNAFFAGETEIMELDTVKENTDMTTDDNNLTQLPLVDKNAQNALRRRIVLQHLNKVLPDLLKSLGLLVLSVSSDVRLLVNTFKLKSNNIMFKSQQWTLIAIVVIKLLSLRDQRLRYLLEQPTAFQHMQLLLLSYKQDGGYLDRLVSWLTDIDRLLDTNDIQLTIS